MLISAAMNVEKFFWYEFRGSETLPDDKESHFGLLHSTLAPKPAYNAYKVLTRMRPEGSTRPSVYIDEHNIWHASWKRPDGTAVTALWSVGLDTPIRAAVSTNLENFQQGINATPRRCHVSLPASSAPVSLYDINGKPVAFQNEIVEVSPSVVYLTGTENVTIRKVTH